MSISAAPPSVSRPPTELLARLARATPAYRFRAWLALSGLLAFGALYLLLTAWFAWTAYRLTFGAAVWRAAPGWAYLGAACAAFLALFMAKAVFFVKQSGSDDGIEVTAQDQPQLFAYLRQLADRAGAPRPHRVFLTPRVNAAVFYDLSVLNLVFPSKKNLEIGLGLVNTLTLGELQAVLAHEFGHFAQRAMAVGRWVYVAQQIAATLVARRDKFDEFLSGLSRVDVRIAWIGWLLRLVVWSIRSLVDSVFQLVVLMQRALSREMELQADLVAVALTGSDALVHALHKLQAADDAWSRALSFLRDEQSSGRAVPDVFAVQWHLIERMGRLLNDAAYGRVPEVDGPPASRRIFKADLAQPPQMWRTHPLNHEREENAKRHYVQADIDGRSAWELFADAAVLREKATAKCAGDLPPQTLIQTTDAALATLDSQFDRAHLQSGYRGVYFGRLLARHVARPALLRTERPAVSWTQAHDRYPEGIGHDVEQLRQVRRELDQLRALRAGWLQLSDKVIRHRGRTYRRKELDVLVLSVEDELAEVNGRLFEHDRLCRDVARDAALKLGQGWPAYLDGLLAVLHYAEHTEAEVRDLQGMFVNTFNVVTATRTVSEAGAQRLVSAANALQNALAEVHVRRHLVQLDESFAARLGSGWQDLFGEECLVSASRETLNQWIGVVDSWVNHTCDRLATLRGHALEQLLDTEDRLIERMRSSSQRDEADGSDVAPKPSTVPERYATLLAGEERPRQHKLGAWDRFQTASGWAPATARLLVSGGIVGCVLGLAGAEGGTTLSVYNGLARPVTVDIGGHRLQVPAAGSASHQIDSGKHYTLEARTSDDRLIESFAVDARDGEPQLVYNVASAAPLVEWTATYGAQTPSVPERPLGVRRLGSTAATVLFTDPPKTVSGRRGSGHTTLNVLSGLGQLTPQQQLNWVQADEERSRLILAHARWDPSDSPQILYWLGMAATLPDGAKVVASRLAEKPDDTVALRAEQDLAEGSSAYQEVCERHRAQSAAHPDSGDWRYLALRCERRSAEEDLVHAEEARRRWPHNLWLAFTVGHAQARAGQWSEAIRAFEQARTAAFLKEWLDDDLARVKRMQSPQPASVLPDMAKSSPRLGMLSAMENGPASGQEPVKVYPSLARGQLREALAQSQGNDGQDARVLRLVAASDGATADMVSRALALPPDAGVDVDTVWVALATSVQRRRDVAPYLGKARQAAGREADGMMRVVDALRSGASPAQIEARMQGLSPQMRGQACSMGVIVMGSRAPAAWRNIARRLLFVTERPYYTEV